MIFLFLPNGGTGGQVTRDGEAVENAPFAKYFVEAGKQEAAISRERDSQQSRKTAEVTLTIDEMLDQLAEELGPADPTDKPATKHMSVSPSRRSTLITNATEISSRKGL
jgi:hypothetical protein